MAQFISSYSYSSITQKDGKMAVKEASLQMKSSDGKHIQGKYMEKIDGKKKEIEFNEKTLHKLPKANLISQDHKSPTKTRSKRSPSLKKLKPRSV